MDDFLRHNMESKKSRNPLQRLSLKNAKYKHQKWLRLISMMIIILFTLANFESFIGAGIFGIIIASVFSIIVATICLGVFGIIEGVITSRIEKKEEERSNKEFREGASDDLLELDENRIQILGLNKRISLVVKLMIAACIVAIPVSIFYLSEFVSDETTELLAFGSMFVVAIPFVIILIVLFNKKAPLDKVYKESFDKSVVNKVLESVFDVKEFDRKKGFEVETINDSQIFPYFDKYRGEDYLFAKYKDHDFTQADVYMSKEEERTHRDRDGNTRIEIVDVTVFSGRLVIVDYDAISNEAVYVHDKRIKKMKTIVETEVQSFNDRFATQADSPLSALRILTPQVLEGILTASNQLNYPMSLAFKDDKIYIAINSGDSFVVTNWSGESILGQQERIKKDVQIILDLIDSIYLK